MKGRQVTIVLIALIALGIAGMVVRVFSTELEEPTLTGVSPLTPDVIDKVVMRDIDGETTLRRVGNQWMIGPYPVVQRRFDDLWETASRFDGAALIATEPVNHTLMGVSLENGTLVEFWQGEVLKEHFVVGDKVYAPVGEKPIAPWSSTVLLCYLRHPDQDEVYAIFCQFPERVGSDPKFWSEPVIVAIPPDEVEAITYIYPEEEFDLRAVDSVWVVVGSGSQEEASTEVVDGVLEELRQLVTSDFPPLYELQGLDFGQPDVSLGVGTKEGVSARSVLLLFLEAEDGAYYVKDSEKSYVYLLDEEAAGEVLKTREGFIPTPTPTPMPTSTPTPSPVPTATPTPTPGS